MTYTGGEFTVEDLFRDLKKRVREEFVSNFNDYVDLIEDFLQEKEGYGFFTADEDLVQIRRDLEGRWPEIKDEIESVSKVLK